MKRFRLQPGHWFSGGLLVFLLMTLYRPAGPGIRPVPHPVPRQAEQRVAVTIYHVVSSDDDSWLEALRGSLPQTVEPMAGALNLMAKLRPGDSPLPPGSRALSVTLRNNGVAWADFNAAFVTNFPGGSLQESLAINSVLLTLSRFPGVRAVQFTVEGKVIESLGGHEDISQPQEVPAPDSI